MTDLVGIKISIIRDFEYINPCYILSLRSMRYVTAIVLLIGMLGSTFSSYCVWLDYAFNKKYIVANLCVNKDRPALKCEGRCYLCRKINNENNKAPESSPRRANFKFQLLSEMSSGSFVFSIPDFITAVHPSYNDVICSSFLPSCFHPPQA